MEKMFHVAKLGDSSVPYQKGVFGTLYECALWIAQDKGGTTDGRDIVIDADDPMGSLESQLEDSLEYEYEINEAPTAIMRMLTIDEGMHLSGAPRGVLSAEEFRDWLDNEQHDKATVFEAAEILHQRHNDVRWRGQSHRQGLSPFTNQQFADLTRELFTS